MQKIVPLSSMVTFNTLAHKSCRQERGLGHVGDDSVRTQPNEASDKLGSLEGTGMGGKAIYSILALHCSKQD